MEFSVPLSVPFSLEFTLESGQLFRWERSGDWWCGIVAGSALKVRQEGDVLRCSSSSDSVDSNFLTRYFRLDEDLNEIEAAISKDDHITRAIETYYGLRVVRQDPWECIASFVLATNSNIPRIKKMISTLAGKYGRPFQFEGEEFREFPSPERLAGASVSELTDCGLGYRAPFLKHVAGTINDGTVEFSRIVALPYLEARALLTAELLGKKLFLGVGPKVADCVLLYSCEKDDAFPIDVWIAKILSKKYPRLLWPALRSRIAKDGKAKLSPTDYHKVSEKVRSYFGEYAGWAQQYLYMAARESTD